MALIPTLTINDSTTFSDTINFSVTDSLTVVAPAQSLSLITVDTTGANNIIVPAANAKVYTYVRHTGTTPDADIKVDPSANDMTLEYMLLHE